MVAICQASNLFLLFVFFGRRLCLISPNGGAEQSCHCNCSKIHNLIYEYYTLNDFSLWDLSQILSI